MKQVITVLLILLLGSVTYAEDVLIIHNSDTNSTNAKNNWKSKLEADGHSVTVNGSSMPSSVSGYEQVFDLRRSSSLSSSDITKMKDVLEAGGTVFINGEHSNGGYVNTQNQTYVSFLRDITGDNNITIPNNAAIMSSSDSTEENRDLITSFGSGEDFKIDYGAYFSNIGTNGKWLIRNPSNTSQVIAALWDGDALSSDYEDGKVIVILDINYVATMYSSSNNENDLFMADIIDDIIVATVNTRSSSSVSITSGQSTIRTAALNADIENGCNVCITQSGSNFTANIRQDGNAHFIVDTDWSGNSTITGDNVTLNIKQGNVTTSGSSDENGLGLYINGNNTNLTVNQGDHANDQGEHKSIIDLNGNSNTVNLTQYDGGTLSKHFAFIDVDALSNNLTITQKDNGQKTIFLDINANSNTGTFIQEDTGLHYLDVTLGSASNTVDITQRGSGNHAARVDLDGYSTDFDLIQQGSSAQSYELDNTCSNALGCTINNTQGTQ